MMNFQTARNTRREARALWGRTRAGKLNPVFATAVRGNEGGMLSQDLVTELDPIAGRLATQVSAEMVSVFVPVQAIDAIKDPAAAYAGMTEVIREKLLSGNPLFGLEAEGEISKRCGVNPRSVGGVKQVNQAVRLAHNAAVNYLRQRKYHKATLLSHTNTAVTPAIIAQTVLDRLNGVLDPDDRINGAVALELPSMNLPLAGSAPVVVTGTAQPRARRAGGTAISGDATAAITINSTGANALYAGTSSNPTFTAAQLDPNGSLTANLAAVTATLNGTTAGNVSLTDFYNAERMDQLTRVMQQIVEDNPQYGEEMVLRWAHGLQVDAGKVPFVIAEKKMMFGRNIVGATDSAGIAAETIRSDMALQMSFTVPVPKTELGGVIITFLVVKPDETLEGQPHPYLSDVWGAENFVADELALDPVPVTIRELDANCTTAQETTVALYTGHNALKQAYVDYGLNRHVNPTTLANKTALWQIKVPMSVTPDNILYPETLSHYPFADQNAEVVTYTITSQMVIQTPTQFGPTPVETLAVINAETLFTE